jgi:hypothetical protein
MNTTALPSLATLCGASLAILYTVVLLIDALEPLDTFVSITLACAWCPIYIALLLSPCSVVIGDYHLLAHHRDRHLWLLHWLVRWIMAMFGLAQGITLFVAIVLLYVDTDQSSTRMNVAMIVQATLFLLVSMVSLVLVACIGCEAWQWRRRLSLAVARDQQYQQHADPLSSLPLATPQQSTHYPIVGEDDDANDYDNNAQQQRQ